MMQTAIFQDRRDAGRRLGERLGAYAGTPELLVLGLARGGIPVAYEVAKALRAPLDAFVVRKLGAPQFPELAIGAIASGAVRVFNWEVLADLNLPAATIESIVRVEERELERREREYRGERPPLKARGRVAILVDDGLATGASMRAAVAALRLLKPSRIVVAVPVAAAQVARSLRGEVDELVCLETPGSFFAIGTAYSDFSQISDDDVRELLHAAAPAAAP